MRLHTDVCESSIIKNPQISMNVSVAANDQTNEDIEKEDNFEKKKEQ